MSQVSGRPCPACGTMVPAGQRFCSNCGTDMTVSGQASQYGAGLQPQNVPPAQQVPPYAQAPGAFGQQQQQVPPYAQAPGAFGQQPQQKSNPIAEALAALGLLFFLRRYRPGYAARRQSSGCCGCLVVLVIFGAIFGIPGYLYYRANANTVNCGLHLSSCRTAASSTTTTVTNTATTATSTTTAHIITATINQKVTYAGVDITIINVQQATSFSDDNPNANGVVRVNINEANNSSSNANYFFSDSAHLILPDGSKIALTHDLQDIGIQSSTTRNNWLDFAVPTSDKINQLTLVLGTDKEAQIIIPLTGNANLSAYQLKMVTPNKPITYWGLNWTLQKATSSLSFGGTQAPTGMRYIVLTFNVDNPSTANVTIGFTDEYMRLKSGAIMNPSTNTTLPLGINASTTGVNGTVTFLMPGNDTAYTLIFLSKQGGINPQPNPQVNTDFTIP